MSYTQNNPFSRKSSPLNKDDQWIQKATADIKKRGTEGVCTGDKFGGPTCPPGSKRYNLAKTFKAMAKDRKGGPSRESSEDHYRYSRTDIPKTNPEDIYNVAKQKKEKQLNEGSGKPSKELKNTGRPAPRGSVSRKSSSPLNQNHNERSGMSDATKRNEIRRQKRLDWQNNSAVSISDEAAKFLNMKKGGFYSVAAIKNKLRTNTSNVKAARRLIMQNKKNVSLLNRNSSSPLNNTGMAGLNYSKELRYMPIEDDMHRGMSRESSSPLDYGSWAHEDAMRAKDLYKKGDYAHARALGIDEHDADYAKHWHKDEAEHGPSRKSRSERLRGRAMKRSERTGAEWGDYDYEDSRVQKMLEKANELDERSGKGRKAFNKITQKIEKFPNVDHGTWGS